MSRFDHLNEAAQYARSDDNPEWLGPAPEWSLHVTGRIIDAGFRDLIDAIGMAAQTLTADDRIRDLTQRAKTAHRALYGMRSGLAALAERDDLTADDWRDAITSMLEITAPGGGAE